MMISKTEFVIGYNLC